MLVICDLIHNHTTRPAPIWLATIHSIVYGALKPDPERTGQFIIKIRFASHQIDRIFSNLMAAGLTFLWNQL